MIEDTLTYEVSEATSSTTDSIIQVAQPMMNIITDSTTEMRRDTLRLPSLFDNFFSMSSKLWHGEASVTGLGESGELVPYTAASDDIVNITILLCIILTAVYFMLSRGFLSCQLYNVLRAPHEGGSRQRETIHQLKYLKYFTLQWALLAAVIIHTYVTSALEFQFFIPSWAMTGIYAGIILVMTTVRDTMRKIPHSIYFTQPQRRLYKAEHATYKACNGLLVLPFAILSIYITDNIVLLGKILVICLIFVKIIEFSKVYSIFFRKKGSFLRFFLYLCTLEAVPILLMVGILTLTTLIFNYSGN